jgi:predicted RecA/RadA family phage recombinase
MKNYVQEGTCITLAAPYDRSAGQGALVGSAFGVATVDVLSGVSAEFQTRGVFDLTKATGAVTQGAKMYWDDTAKKVTTTSTSNTLIGYATQAQASGDTTCRVRLGIVA